MMQYRRDSMSPLLFNKSGTKIMTDRNWKLMGWMSARGLKQLLQYPEFLLTDETYRVRGHPFSQLTHSLTHSLARLLTHLHYLPSNHALLVSPIRLPTRVASISCLASEGTCAPLPHCEVFCRGKLARPILNGCSQSPFRC